MLRSLPFSLQGYPVFLHGWWRSPRKLITCLLLGSLCLTSYGCGRPQPSPEPEEVIEPNPENQLVVANAILEQSDETGQLLWKLQTEEAIYSQDRKVATVTGIVGNLYEAGEIILSLQADAGQIINDGERIILETNIVATDNRINAVLQTNRAEWQPGNSLLLIEEELEGKYLNGQFTSKQGQYFIDRSELELEEEVDALTVEPPLRMQSEKIVWSFEEDIVTAEAGLEVQQYTEEKITTRLQAKTVEVRIKELEVDISEDVLLNNLEPKVQFASKEAFWDLEAGMIKGKDAVQITHETEKVQFQGDEGAFDLEQQLVQLRGNVRGVGTDPPTTLRAESTDWYLESQELVAEGNVIYEQASPRVTLTGDRAVGRFSENRLVISGSGGKPVTTKVVP